MYHSISMAAKFVSFGFGFFIFSLVTFQYIRSGLKKTKEKYQPFYPYSRKPNATKPIQHGKMWENMFPSTSQLNQDTETRINERHINNHFWVVLF